MQSKLNALNNVLTALHFIDKWGPSYRVGNYKESNLKGEQFYFELVGCSSYWGFELSGVNCIFKKTWYLDTFTKISLANLRMKIIFQMWIVSIPYVK